MAGRCRRPCGFFVSGPALWHTSCDSTTAVGCETRHKKEEAPVSAAVLEREIPAHEPAAGIDDALELEYREAMERYGPPYPDAGWFRRAARLERQMREARMETKFDEN